MTHITSKENSNEKVSATSLTFTLLHSTPDPTPPFLYPSPPPRKDIQVVLEIFFKKKEPYDK